jgi:hypothetical protein
MKNNEEFTKRSENKPSCSRRGCGDDPRMLISKVVKALKKEDSQEKVQEFMTRTHECNNYDDILTLALEYVDFESVASELR